MAISAKHGEVSFGVGDTVRVHQKISENGKTRIAIFEGMVLGIKGEGENKTFLVRKIGAQKIGIEQIFPLSSPTIEKVEVKRHGKAGVRQAKIYYVREKSKRDIEKIYTRNTKKTPKK